MIIKKPYGIIYTITHNTTGKVYVGQTRQLLKRRLVSHKLKAPYRTSYIDRAIQKEGIIAFTVTELCSVLGTQDELNALEQYFIEHFQSLVPNGYNLTLGGRTCVFSDEAKKKMFD